jgi:hypothetical protein
MLKAFLVKFREDKPQWNPYQTQQYPSVVPDNRPVLVIAEDIGSVASKNRAAIRIEELDVKDVLINKKK